MVNIQNETLMIGDIRWHTSAEGPGTRTALWFQGCQLACPGCCNPHLQPFKGGTPYSPEKLVEEIHRRGCPSLTLLGGEPLDQAVPLSRFLQLFRSENPFKADIWLFTGYTWQEVQEAEERLRVAALCDLVIAGPYSLNHQPDKRKWIGSTNQTIHPITLSGKKFIENWPENQYDLEVTITDDEVMLNGWPI